MQAVLFKWLAIEPVSLSLAFSAIRSSASRRLEFLPGYNLEDARSHLIEVDYGLR